MSLEGQVGIVTGAASGIGEAVARRLAADGATVVGVDINDPAAVIDEINAAGGRAEGAVSDVSSAEGWRDLVNGVVARHGSVRYLVNVAGIPVMDPEVADTVTSLTEAWWDRLLAVNLKGTWLGMKTVIPHLKAEGGGRIVNISSLAASRGVPSLAAYSASKGGVEALTRQAAAEYAADGINITAVAPGTVLTPLLRAQTEEFLQANAQKHMLPRLGETHEIASLVAYLLAEGGFVTGAVFASDGGWAAKG